MEVNTLAERGQIVQKGLTLLFAWLFHHASTNMMVTKCISHSVILYVFVAFVFLIKSTGMVISNCCRHATLSNVCEVYPFEKQFAV